MMKPLTRSYRQPEYRMMRYDKLPRISDTSMQDNNKGWHSEGGLSGVHSGGLENYFDGSSRLPNEGPANQKEPQILSMRSASSTAQLHRVNRTSRKMRARCTVGGLPQITDVSSRLGPKDLCCSKPNSAITAASTDRREKISPRKTTRDRKANKLSDQKLESMWIMNTSCAKRSITQNAYAKGNFMDRNTSNLYSLSDVSSPHRALGMKKYTTLLPIYGFETYR